MSILPHGAVGRGARWALAAAGLVAAVLAVRQCGRGRYQHRVVFPRNPPAARLAIRDPLVRPDLTVVATLRGDRGRGAPVWMTVDSGATGVTLPGSTYHSLGLDTLTGVTIRTEDALGQLLVRDAGLVPTVVLGPLVLSEVVTAIGGGSKVIGQSVLAHGPWEVDWDRGTFTLGVVPWAADAETVLVPLRRFGESDVVTIQVDGASVDMVIDTGAIASTIPDTVGREAGLAMRGLRFPARLRTVAGDVTVRKVFTGDVRLGALEVGRMDFATLSTAGRRAALGLLGLDLLSRYRVQVVPGAHLALRPRGDVRTTAAERIARWAFLPACKHPGCLQAKLDPAGDDATLTVSFEADVRRPIELLLGCATEDAEKAVRPESTLVFERSPAASTHVRVRLPSGTPGTPSVMKIARGGLWFGASGAGCGELQALDLSPTTLVPADAATESEADPNVASAANDGDGELHASLLP
jgi:predicted aspartyl protease